MVTAEQFANMTEAEKLALLQRLSQQRQTKLGMKVTEKGGVAVYGLGRFPVTLYRSQWERILESAEAIKGFIEAHADELASKA